MAVIFTARAEGDTDTTTSTAGAKIKFRFGGRIDMSVFTDSRRNVESRGGLQYNFPAKPVFDNQGQDINAVGQLRFGIGSTRLNFEAVAAEFLGARARGFVEVDFMGVSDNVLQTLRLRHAFVDLQWNTRSLLFGQTSHLTMVDEVAANTVTFGGGFSINPLNRPVQVQFKQQFDWASSTLAVAVAMFSGNAGLEQTYAMIPDVQVRYTLNPSSKLFLGAGAGFKAIKPLAAQHLNSGTINRSEELFTFNGTIFARYRFDDRNAIKFYAIMGEDLSPLSIIGGYAPIVGSGTKFAPIVAASTFLDYEHVINKSWEVGIFGGWQKNIGTFTSVTLSDAHIPNQGIDNNWRVAPRVYYNLGKSLTFGLEYMLSGAVWGKEFDSFYIPTVTYDEVYNNRVTFLARFRF